MRSRALILTLTAALFAAPPLSRAQMAPLGWDADVYSALKARLADFPAPASPASQPAAPGASEPTARARALFQRPLIVGASVSAGYRAESPARRLARRLGTESAVVSLASPGATGARQVEAITDAELAAATVVVGVDLFFWDTQRDCPAGLKGVDELFLKLAPRNTPIVLANVPAMHVPFGLGGGAPGCREEMNGRIAKACAADKTCILLDLNALYAKARADGGVDMDGREVPVQDLQSDGLHLSDAGTELMSRAILAAIEAPAGK